MRGCPHTSGNATPQHASPAGGGPPRELRGKKWAICVFLPQILPLFSPLLPSELNLEGNLLHRLPEELGSLLHLRAINLARNKFRRFPEPLAAAPALESIDLEGNEIAGETGRGWRWKPGVKEAPVQLLLDLLLGSSIRGLGPCVAWTGGPASSLAPQMETTQ